MSQNQKCMLTFVCNCQESEGSHENTPYSSSVFLSLHVKLAF